MTLSPLKVDPEIDQLISNGAHFLGLTKKELVAEAVQVYLEIRQEEIRQKMQEAMAQLDGTNRSRLAMLTGLSADRIDELGGVRETR
ncbi:MAG TPA: hypothetical protein VHX38_36135 [Pseudonocardiaceae bacterium]|nr:hypothetical protein [Pseudonocardiaceae bacterium]